MREKALRAKMGERCSRQKERQVQSPEAGRSSECLREAEGGLCGREEAVWRRVVGKREEGSDHIKPRKPS